MNLDHRYHKKDKQKD